MIDETSDDAAGPDSETQPEPRKLAPKPPKDRHPLLLGTPVGVWCEAAAGRVKGYPRTLATFEKQCETLRANSEAAHRAGKMTRRGVGNGWAGRKVEVAALRESVRPAAAAMAAGLLGASEDDPLAVEALTEAAAVALSDTYVPSIRVRAARLFMDFTLPKPLHKSAVNMGHGGLAFLAALAAKTTPAAD